MALDSIINSPELADRKLKLLESLKVLVDAEVFSRLARQNANQLVDGRMDSDDESAIAKEVREIRQTNRILLGLEESAKQLTEGFNNA